MKRHGYLFGIAAVMTGCMLWSGCGTKESGELPMEASLIGAADSATAASEKPQSGAAAGTAQSAPAAAPLLEQLFSYEAFQDFYGDPYLVITGVAEEYRKSFWKNMADIIGRSRKDRYMLIPADINGIPVWGIGEEAFADMDIQTLSLPAPLKIIEAGAFRNTGIINLDLPQTLRYIGDEAFRNVGVYRLDLPENLEYIGARAFEGCDLTCIQFPDSLLTIGERAFAGNQRLWTALVPDVETILEDGVFADCEKGFLLCYGNRPSKKGNLVADYARQQGFDSMEIMLTKDPIVRYPDEPLTLEAEIRNFFYGEYGDDEDERWCSWEEAEDAPNFGYEDWQAPGCSSWCGVCAFEQMAEASSELASVDGKYVAENVLIQDRQNAWVEGAAGCGIGESLTYRQSCTGYFDNEWEVLVEDRIFNIEWEPGRDYSQDCFFRYSEICIVNGYAKNRQTWEKNGRVKRLLMYVEGRPYAYLELEDTMLPQYFMLPEGDIKVPDGGMLEARFEILEVYPGSQYEDTCLTGLVMEFTGRHAH